MPIELLIELLLKQPREYIFTRKSGKTIRVHTSEIVHYLKELEVHKKALELACDELGEFCCTQTMLTHKCDSDCSKHWKDYFLKKVREKE